MSGEAAYRKSDKNLSVVFITYLVAQTRSPRQTHLRSQGNPEHHTKQEVLSEMLLSRPYLNETVYGYADLHADRRFWLVIRGCYSEVPQAGWLLSPCPGGCRSRVRQRGAAGTLLDGTVPLWGPTP